MKRKWIVLPLCLACTLTAVAAAACTPQEEDNVRDYTFEDYEPEMGAPDEGFTIDGVLDEAVYSQKRWLRAVKVEKTDGLLDYDVAVAAIEDAATIGMTTHYGTKGMYVALEYKAAVGEQLYVNPDRSSTQNSIAELYLAMPQATSIEDKYVCEVDMQPDGTLVFKKNNWGGNWDNFATTNDIMAQLGVQTNGVVGEFVGEGEQRATQYSMELYIPWDYIDKIGGEGTADLIKAGDVRMNLAPITSYNYQGTDGTVDRWWWMLGSQLDDGAWGNLNGWYHFNGDGLIAYDIDIEVTGEGGSIMERFGYEQAVANNSVTFLTKTDETHAIKSITVNGKDYTDQPSAIGNGSFTVPASEVTQDLQVSIEFMEYTPEAEEYTFDVTLNRFGIVTAAPEGATLSLTGINNYSVTVGENGRATIEMLPGTYTASIEVDGETEYLDTRVLLRIGSDETNVGIEFGNDVFTQALYGDWTNTTIDDSNAYGENGYITNTGNSVLAVTNESFTDSVFTVKLNNSNKSSNRWGGPALIFDDNGTARGVRFSMVIQNGKIDVQLEARNDGNIQYITPEEYTNDTWHWFSFDTDGSFTEAWNNGTSLAFTIVRSGAELYLFVGIDGDDAAPAFLGKCTIPEDYAKMEGHWTVFIADAPNATYYISLDDREETVADWTQFSVTLPETMEGGSVSADRTTAKVGETITVSVTPDIGYAVASFTVNGVPAQIMDGKVELTYEEYGREITVAVTFEEAEPVEVTFTVPALARLGQDVALNGKTVTFSSTTSQTATVTDGAVTVSLVPGTYTVTLNGYGNAVASLAVTVDNEGNATVDGEEGEVLAFTYDTFGGNTVGNPGSPVATIDDSTTNEDGTVSANGKFWTLMNEQTNASVFTVTVKFSDLSAGSVYFGYLFSDNKGVLAQLDVQRNADALTGLNLQWRMWSGDYISDDNILNIGFGGASTTDFNTAFQGDGVDITIVRAADGKTFYMFLSAHGDDSLSLRTWKNIPDGYASQTGIWAFGADSPVADADFAVGLETDAEKVAATVEQAYFSVNASKADGEINNHGEISVSAERALILDGSITVTVNADVGYVIDQLLVNGTDRAADLANGSLTLTAADCPEGSQTITVVASFKEATTAQIEASVTANRFGKEIAEGLTIIFAGSTSTQLTVTGGKVTGTLNVGDVYTVSVDGYPFSTLTVTAEADGTLKVTGGEDNALVFVYDVFEAGGVGNMNDLVIDESHANDADSYFVNKHHNTVLANTNETFGDSVFTVTFKNSQATKNNRWGIEYIVDVNGTEYGLRATVKVSAENDATNGKLMFQWYGESNPQWGWGISNINPVWDRIALESETYNADAYKNAFLTGDGIDFTAVRSGNDIYYFVTIHGQADSTLYCGSFTLTGDYVKEGCWAIAIADAKQGEQIHFSLSDDAEEVAEWVGKASAEE